MQERREKGEKMGLGTRREGEEAALGRGDFGAENGERNEGKTWN